MKQLECPCEAGVRANGNIQPTRRSFAECGNLCDNASYCKGAMWLLLTGKETEIQLPCGKTVKLVVKEGKQR